MKVRIDWFALSAMTGPVVIAMDGSTPKWCRIFGVALAWLMGAAFAYQLGLQVGRKWP